jgi:hypothetical protein
VPGLRVLIIRMVKKEHAYYFNALKGAVTATLGAWSSVNARRESVDPVKSILLFLASTLKIELRPVEYSTPHYL